VGGLLIIPERLVRTMPLRSCYSLGRRRRDRNIGCADNADSQRLTPGACRHAPSSSAVTAGSSVEEEHRPLYEIAGPLPVLLASGPETQLLREHDRIVIIRLADLAMPQAVEVPTTVSVRPGA